MKLKTLLLLTVLFLFLTSCKKGKNSSANGTIKYEVTWSAALSSSSPNQILYTNATGNSETDSNLSGNSWTKTVSFQSTNSTLLQIGALIYLQQQGTCDVKIYVNGVLESENSGTGINTGGTYGFDTEAHYQLN